MIRKQGRKFVLYSKDGRKRLGVFDSVSAARNREDQIKYFASKK